MPVIRTELAEFVRVWNSHYIRKQRNRPHVVPGQPWTLYYQYDAAQVQSFAEVIPEERLRTLQDLFENDHIDLDAYLPSYTMDLCARLISEREQVMPFPHDPPETPYITTYLFLWDQLRQYILSKQQPSISLLPTPTGGLNRVREFLESHDIQPYELFENSTNDDGLLQGNIDELDNEQDNIEI